MQQANIINMNHNRSTALERSVKITGELKPVLRDPNLALSWLKTYSCSVRVKGISLNVTNQVIYIQIVLPFDTAFLPLLKISNLDLSLLLSAFFAFACVIFLLRISLLTSGVIQGTEDTDLLVLEGICLSADSQIRKLSNQFS